MVEEEGWRKREMEKEDGEGVALRCEEKALKTRPKAYLGQEF